MGYCYTTWILRCDRCKRDDMGLTLKYQGIELTLCTKCYHQFLEELDRIERERKDVVTRFLIAGSWGILNDSEFC